jgi:mannose-6-phosphate isomerase
LEKSFAAMRLTTRAGKVPPKTVDGHSVLIDERYFRIERWRLPTGTTPEFVAPSKVVQMLFVTAGSVPISGDGFDPFTVERNQIAVIPSASPRWSLNEQDDAEIIRILPAAD